jgi:hypothetical protein
MPANHIVVLLLYASSSWKLGSFYLGARSTTL